MDPEKDEAREDEDLISKLGKAAKDTKNNFSKFTMLFRKAIAAVTAPAILPIILIVIIAGIIVGALCWLATSVTTNQNSSVAISSTIEETVSIDKTSDGYYYKIDKDVISKYIEKLNKAYEDDEEEVDEELEEIDQDEDASEDDDVIDEVEDEEEDDEEYEYDEEDENNEYTQESIQEWFQTDDTDLCNSYIVKMIRAQIASSYPKLSDYDGKDGTEDSQGNKKNGINGDYVAQGVVEIQRTTIDEEGNQGEATTLTYLPYDEFSALIEKNDSKALNYYSFDFDSDSEMIYYATYTKTVVTENGSQTSSTYTLKENSASYSSLIAMCSMPYDFLFSLLQATENPEYVMAVVDLLLENSEVVLMIQDQLSITEYTVVESQVEKTEKQKVTAEYDEDDEEEENGEWVYGDIELDGYEFPAGNTITTVTTIYTNTANVYIQKANTWCMDFEQEATISSTSTEGDEIIETYSDDDYGALTYGEATITYSKRRPIKPKGSYTVTYTYLSEEYLTYSNKTDTANYTASTSISTEKKINTDKFLGLWKNDTGEYYSGCTYDADGTEVYYEIPDGSGDLSPVESLSEDSDGEDIDYIIELLAMNSNTQTHEQLMMYYWNVYFGEDVYEINIDLEDLFNTSTLASVGSGDYIVNTEVSSSEIVITDLETLKTAFSGYSGSSKLVENAQCFLDMQEQYGVNAVFAAAVSVVETGGGRAGHAIDGKQNWFNISCTCGNSSHGRFETYSSVKDSIEAFYKLIANGSYYFTQGNYTVYNIGMIYCEDADADGGWIETVTSIMTQMFNAAGIDVSSYTYSNNSIVASAIQVHEYVRTNGYQYAQAGITVPNYRTKTIDCSSFVTWVLVNAGVNGFSEGMYQWNSSTFRSNPQGWQEVSVSDAQPGDILVYSGHVEIVAATGSSTHFTVYNCGGNGSIKASGSSDLPESSTSGHTKSSVLKVLRVS